MNGKHIIYSLNVNDLQCVAQDVLNRDLTELEVEIIKRNLGYSIDWYTAVEFSILNIQEGHTK